MSKHRYKIIGCVTEYRSVYIESDENPEDYETIEEFMLKSDNPESVGEFDHIEDYEYIGKF